MVRGPADSRGRAVAAAARLAAWLAGDSAGRQVRAAVTVAAAGWAASGRQDDDLYRGARLVAALDWADSHPDQLIGVEREFLAASAQAAQAHTRELQARAAREARAGRRLRRLLACTVASLVAVAMAAVLALQAGQRSTRAALQADAERLAAQALLEPRQDLALLLAAQAVRLYPDAETNGDLLAALLRAPRALRMRQLGSRLQGITVSPDGRLIAVSDNEGSITLLDAASLRTVRKLASGAGYPVTGLEFTGDGRRLVSSDQLPAGARLAVRDVATGRLLARFPVPDLYQAVASPDGSSYAGSAVGGGFLWSRGRAGWVQHRLGPVTVAGFTPDGRFLVTVSPAAGAALVDARTGRVTRRIPAARGQEASALSPDGRLLATSDAAGTISIWELATGRLLAQMAGQTGTVESLQFGPGGRTLLSAASDHTAVLWDVRDADRLQVLAAGAGLPFAALRPDGRVAWTADQDGTVIAWDLTGRYGFGTAVAAPAGTQAAAYAPAGGPLLAGTAGAGNRRVAGTCPSCAGRPVTGWPPNAPRRARRPARRCRR